MSTENYDAIQFAASMKSQSYDLMPREFSEEEKDFIANILYDFTCKAYEALRNDDELNFTEENIRFISQIIAEWMFHKAVDLIKASIPEECREDILLKIAFTIFEVSKEAIKIELSQSTLLQAVEHHVDKVWKQCIEELYLNNLINPETKQTAQNQSNLDDMAEQYIEREKNKEKNEAEDTGIVSKSEIIVNLFFFITTIISAAIMTAIFVYCYKHFNIDKLMADRIILYSEFIGWGALSVYFISWLFLSRFCSVTVITFKLESIIPNISKNLLFYCGCLILSSLIVYKNSAVFNSTETLAAVIFILISAIAAVKSYGMKLVREALIASSEHL